MDSDFDALLTPHRSLNRRGTVILFGSIVAAAAMIGGFFVAQGVWPVLPFFGCEVLLLALAFRANNRDARAYETVKLTPQALTVCQVKASGRALETRFQPPQWLKVVLTLRPDGGNRLELCSHGRRLVIGHFLASHERADFADALRRALARLQRPLQGSA